MKLRLVQIFSIVFLLASCGGGGSSESESSTTDTATESVQEDVPAEVTLELSSNDQMQYDKAQFRVKSGQKVTLTLTHTGQMDKAVMGHNFVLLKKGTDVAAFATEAISAADNEYIPESDAIIAHTSLIGGGETTSVTFDAPEPGIYDYICSFPGHYSIMRGKFLVE
ncbi:azurin [Algoriphagus sediminis]|uniref:Azurin n=1 Tax=Algoriphagus sediminis TaxID=3057113 RepID=A0ABT7YB70_9BACT|nr:azurin [Algoriphagus sediminis]MDN3203762.1 azurin [Algoriphagus sediminis]